MIVKNYNKIDDKGYCGQDKNSWSNHWKNETVEKNAFYGDRDYLSYFLKKHFPKPPQKILEGGCGIGQYVIAYQKLGYDIVGVDFSEVLINKLKAFDKTLPVYEANIKKLPFDNKYFDCYFSGGVFEHFEEGCDEVVREANRVLKMGGSLLMTVPYINIIRRIFRKDYGACKRTPYFRKYKFREYYFDIKGISPYLVNNGFIIKETHPFNFLWGELGFLFRKFSKVSKKLPNSKNLYDFFIREKRENRFYNFILTILNYLSGNMVFIVAKKYTNIKKYE